MVGSYLKTTEMEHGVWYHSNFFKGNKIVWNE